VPLLPPQIPRLKFCLGGQASRIRSLKIGPEELVSYEVCLKFGSEGLAPYSHSAGRSLKPKTLLPRRLYGDKYKHLAPPSERKLKS
jgi:hypothetical protein